VAYSFLMVPFCVFCLFIPSSHSMFSVTLLTEAAGHLVVCFSHSAVCCVVAVLLTLGLPGELGQQTGPVHRAAAQMFVLVLHQGC